MHRDLSTAIRLLEATLKPVATIETPPDHPEETLTHGPVRACVVLSANDTGRTAALTLRLDEPESDHEPPRRDVVLVLKKAPASRLARLRAADRQFVDVGRRAVRIRLPGIYVDRSDVELPVESFSPQQRAYLDPFGDRASLICRLLVEQPARGWGAREIAAAAGVSTMTASHVLRQLREIGVVEVHKRGRAFEARLSNLARMIEHWTRAHEWNRSTSLSVEAPVGSPDRFLRRLPEALTGHRWALTMQAGASLVAPHATWETVHLYIDVSSSTSLNEIARSAGWAPGAGRLVLMRPWYAHSAWMGVRTIKELPVVSDLQLVLDLWHYPVRGREQADLLLEIMEKRIRDTRSRST